MCVNENILACDVGLKRIGLACQISGIVVPLTPIFRKNRNQAAKELKNILLQRQITLLLVGIPKLEGEDSHAMERRIKHFIGLVEFEGKILYINECLSSKEAFERLLPLSKKERQEKIKNGELDSLSAMIILERHSHVFFAKPS